MSTKHLESRLEGRIKFKRGCLASMDDMQQRAAKIHIDAMQKTLERIGRGQYISPEEASA